MNNKISRNFIPPAPMSMNLEYVVDVRIVPGGRFMDAQVGRCNGGEALRRAVVADFRPEPASRDFCAKLSATDPMHGLLQPSCLGWKVDENQSGVPGQAEAVTGGVRVVRALLGPCREAARARTRQCAKGWLAAPVRS
jgi:hypothetical protein